uniref:Uncharacterized protein n=1 Tax=Octopus bimaculoides TaxID=37653 RepID=A0A0L8GHD1_OCTBM
MYPSAKIINIVAVIISLVAFTTVVAQNVTTNAASATYPSTSVNGSTTVAPISNSTSKSGAAGIESVCSQAFMTVISLVILLFNFIVSH